ncbi:hypothetical protein [Desulfovibrio gilichinskyi]|uniref:Uncharacterized protein n=1 Tax=Desulfovibrio gilichinskyi TaxID=1519643 RepID=A0A1X7EKA7_9BACT|nr:hypothetical protein [Desulfovibrio gilichinskyi]SMF35406.1 hypothetical protein SAMN06295933_3077 [Desulfovibrio gilichinskyi]
MRKIDYKKLFNEYDIALLFKNNLSSITSQVESINGKDFLNIPANKTVARLVAENSLNELKLYGHFIKAQRPVKYRKDAPNAPSQVSEGKRSLNFSDVSKIRIEIPFSGDERLWLLRPSTFNEEGSLAFGIENGRLIKDYSQHQHIELDLIKTEFMSDLRKIKKHLHWQNLDIQQYTNELQETVEEAVTQRIAKLHQLAILSKRSMISMKSRDGSADFSPINTRQRLIPLPLTNSAADSDHTISKEDFIKIIRVIRHTGSSCERTPHVFKVHNDNELRDIIISTLNTQFEDSTGKDIFLKEGKTTITVSQGGKSVVTGICKIWSSEARFIETVDKLLQHDSWHDSKAILVIFNKNNSVFSEILNAALHIITSHRNFISLDEILGDNEWHFTMQSEYDKSYRINLRVIVFNIYAENSNPVLRLTEQEMDFFKI